MGRAPVGRFITGFHGDRRMLGTAFDATSPVRSWLYLMVLFYLDHLYRTVLWKALCGAYQRRLPLPPDSGPSDTEGSASP